MYLPSQSQLIYSTQFYYLKWCLTSVFVFVFCTLSVFLYLFIAWLPLFYNVWLIFFVYYSVDIHTYAAETIEIDSVRRRKTGWENKKNTLIHVHIRISRQIKSQRRTHLIKSILSRNCPNSYFVFDFAFVPFPLHIDFLLSWSPSNWFGLFEEKKLWKNHRRLVLLAFIELNHWNWLD